jgi:hypothetical protein
VLVETELGTRLKALLPALLSRRAGRGYLGYLGGQKERLLGTRGQRNVNRPELVEAHGYDTKYAMHALRIAHQGIELLTTGRITLPVGEPARASLREVRAGEVPLDEVLRRVDEASTRLEEASRDAGLPAKSDVAAVDDFLVSAYRRAWDGGLFA